MNLSLSNYQKTSNTQKFMILLGILLSVGITIIFSFNLLLALVSISILYKILSPLLKSIVFDSVFIRISITFFVYVILLQAILVSAWLVNKNFSLDFTILLTLPFIVGTYIYQKRYFKLPVAKVKDKALDLIKIDDITSIIIASLLLFVVGAIPLITRGLANDAGAMATIGENSDDASHLAYINDRLQFNRGILYESDAVNKVRSEGQAGIYPAGWHSVNAVIIKAFNPTVSVGSESLISYVLSKLSWYFLLVYFFVRTVFSLYRAQEKNAKTPLSPPVFIWIGLASLFFSLYFTVDIFSQGFYSFIPQLLSALLLILVFIQTTDENDIPATIPLLALLCIGGSLSWFLMLPAFLLASLIYIASLTQFSKIKQTMALVIHGLNHFLPMILLLLLAILTQYYVMSTSPTTVTFVQGILLSGKIITHPIEVYVFTAIGIILLFLSTTKARSRIERIIPLILAVLIFSSIIYLIQKYYTGQNMYYFYKTMYIFLIAAIPLAIATIAHRLKQFNKAGALPYYGAFLSIMSLIIFTPLPSTSVEYMRGARGLPLSTTNSVHTVIDSDDNTPSNYYEENYVLYFNPGDTEGNDISTLLVKANKIDSKCFNQLRPLLWASVDITPFVKAKKEHCSGEITIITSSDNYPKFKEQLELDNSPIILKELN